MTRFWSITGMIIALGAPAVAEEISTEDVYACTAIEADAERLACYDAAVGRLQAAEEAGEVTTVTRKEVEQVQKDSFGFSIPSLPSIVLGKSGEDGNLTEVTQPVKSIRGGRGSLIVYLENGQIWRQTDSKAIRNSGQSEAQIYEAALGSYKIKLDGGLAFRAERIK